MDSDSSWDCKDVMDSMFIVLVLLEMLAVDDWLGEYWNDEVREVVVQTIDGVEGPLKVETESLSSGIPLLRGTSDGQRFED